MKKVAYNAPVLTVVTVTHKIGVAGCWRAAPESC